MIKKLHESGGGSVRPRSNSGTRIATQAAKARRASAVERLIAHKTIPDGTELTIVVPDQVGQDRETIRTWLATHPDHARVHWHNDVSGPVEWAHDGARWRLIRLISHIIETATGQPPNAQVWAQSWFRDQNERTLHHLAEPLP